MNAQIQAITDALTTTDGDKLHDTLVNRSQKLRQTLDKVTACVTDREGKYDKIKALRDEMDTAMQSMFADGPTSEHRPVTKIAADLKRVNDSLDKDIEKVYDLISEADALRTEVAQLVGEISAVPLVATAA